MNDIYTVLMSVPLLNGVSREKMLEITGKTKFHFVKYAAGEKIASAGEQCSHIKLLVSGSVTLTTNYCNKRKNVSITVSQTLDAPAALAVEYLFGIATTYPCDITAITPVNVVQIEKFDYMKLISGNPILMLNYINFALVLRFLSNDEINLSGDESLEELVSTLLQVGKFLPKSMFYSYFQVLSAVDIDAD